MPQKNSIKIYSGQSYYHIYNRGIEKRIIYMDDQDYQVFLKYLKESLSEPNKNSGRKVVIKNQKNSVTFSATPRLPKNFLGEIKLLCYCLMPNHFHLLIYQKDRKSLETFTRSILTRYSKYFNRKYKRVGPLFQGRYKAIRINNDNYLLHLSRYIHLNSAEYQKDLVKTYSSYADYIGTKKTPWINTRKILDYFKQGKSNDFTKYSSYKKFVEDYKADQDEIIKPLILE